MLFEDRVEAGKKLADKLDELKKQNPLILALPRGGVPVGFEIAKRLNAPLDVLVVRKLGAPFNPELGIGAIAPGGIRVLDNTAIKHLGISEEQIELIEEKEREELDRRIREYRGHDSIPDVRDKTVILVDDGLATGITCRAALRAVLNQNPKNLVIAIPVCAHDAAEGIRSILRPRKDEVVCLTVAYGLMAVGYWYRNFDAVSDLEVIHLLRKSKNMVKKNELSLQLRLKQSFSSKKLLQETYDVETEAGLHPVRLR